MMSQASLLFPSPFSCFRDFIFNFENEARSALSSFLPFIGPIPNNLLFKYLSIIVRDYGIDASSFLVFGLDHVCQGVFHVNKTYYVSLSHVLFVLHSYPHGVTGMDPQRMIEQSASVNAATIATNEVSRLFRSNLDSMIPITAKLSKQQQKDLETEIGGSCSVRYLNEKPILHDHPVIYALRELSRVTYDRLVKPKQTNLKTLCIGVSHREVSNYWDNENVFFNYHGSESKDVVRFVTESMKMVNKVKMKKCAAKNTDALRLKVNKINDCINTLTSSNVLPDRFDQDLTGQYHQLLCEDVGYNFSNNDWVNLFEKTGAMVCHGYMFLPYELIFDEVVSTGLYRYTEYKDFFTTMSCVTFNHSNGYTHNKKNWSTLLRHCVIRNESCSLMCEFVSRFGPMTVFSIVRVPSRNNEAIVRTLALPDHMIPVKVLDIPSCVGKDGRVNSRLKYILMRREEFDDTMNYVLSLDKKSMILQNVITFVRRRLRGVSLIASELVSAWELTPSRVLTISLTVLLYAQQQLLLVSNVFQNIDVGSRFERWLASVRIWFDDHAGIISKVIDFLRRGHLDGKLVINVDSEKFQLEKLKFWDEKSFIQVIERGVVYEDTDEHESDVCVLCEVLRPHLGSQDVRCSKGSNVHSFSLSKDELAVFAESLSDDVSDPVGLKEVKSRAHYALPKSGFSCDDVVVHYLKGGPGSGKSRLIRSLAKEGDLIVAPFSKLKTDYIGCAAKFMTQHKAMCATNHRRIFVDEFTALSYEFLSCIVYNSAVEEVFLVGDLGQTGIIEGQEGISIRSKIAFDNFATHELVKDFRNPLDAVTVVNDFYDYNMEAVSNSLGFRFRHVDMWNLDAKLTPLIFTKNTGFSLGLQDDNIVSRLTIRSNQGSTHDDVGLFVTSHDSLLGNFQPLNVVGLTRHRNKCVVFFDNSDFAITYVAKLRASFNKIVDGLVKVPTKNLCLLNSLCTLLNEYSESKFTVLDLWRNLVCVVGVDEARSIRDSMLTTKHLSLLCEDLSVKVQLLVPGSPVQTFGTGSFIGGLKWSNAHYTPDSKCPRLVNRALDVLSSFTFDVSRSSTACSCGKNIPVCKSDYPDRFRVLTPRVANRSFNMGVYGNDTSLVVKVFGNDETILKPNDDLFKFISTNCVDDVDTGVFVTLRVVFKNTCLSYTDLPFSNGYRIVVFGGDTSLVVGCGGDGKNGFDVKCSDGDFVTIPSKHDVTFSNLSNKVSFILFGTVAGSSVPDGSSLPVAGGLDGDEFEDDSDIPSFEADFAELALTFSDHEPGFPVADDSSLVVPDVIVPLEQTPHDSFLLLREMFDVCFGMPSQFTNEYATTFVGSEFSRGNLNLTTLDNLNMRGHPVSNKLKFFSVTVNGPGLYYHQKSFWQELQCIQSRYFGRVLAADCDVHGVQIAYSIADMFVDEHMDVSRCTVEGDELNSTTLTSLRAMRSKNYEKMVHLTDGGVGANVVRFHMKDIFKPFKDKVDITKAGQGISAWSKEAQSLFQTACRVINVGFKRGLHSNVIYDNLDPEQEVLEHANLLLSSLPSVCSNGVIDATACDSGQNAFTQAIERRILERMGVSEFFLDYYYRFRKGYYLQSKVASGHVDWIKTSGEPATLLCNTILMMALMNALLRGEGPCVLLGKGDDGLKRQANLKYNDVLVGRFRKYTKLQFKVDIDQPVNFCGYSLVGSRLYPCVLRKAQKAVGHKFRDYSHFCEYQQSLRDWILMVNKLGILETIATTCQFSGLSNSCVTSLFHALQSLCHLNYDQFIRTFNYFEIDVDETVPDATFHEKARLNFSVFEGGTHSSF